jgi:NADH:ubiquinone oxidoreductase subunit 3 (subunit A)
VKSSGIIFKEYKNLQFNVTTLIKQQHAAQLRFIYHCSIEDREKEVKISSVNFFLFVLFFIILYHIGKDMFFFTIEVYNDDINLLTMSRE